jgi:SAM-dependent methyltransferase
MAHIGPSPDGIVTTACAYQRSAALAAAIDLDVFTVIGDGATTAAAIASRCEASETGMSVLCDYLTVIRLLDKKDGAYSLTAESSLFLSRRSDSYLGGGMSLLMSPGLLRGFDDVRETIRKGRKQVTKRAIDNEGAWLRFAQGMAPLMRPAATALAELVAIPNGRAPRVLDIAAGHGAFGIALARKHPHAEIVALDWPEVLEVAATNAMEAGVGERYRTMAGDALSVEFGCGYDVVLLTNFLHHCDPSGCARMLRKAAAALAPGGRLAILEFVPDADRVSPPFAASFSLMLLASVSAGDTYTFGELSMSLADAGFINITQHPLPTSQTVILARQP